MDPKKLESLVKTLLKMAAEQELPNKYNSTIVELLNAEDAKNVTVFEHCGKPVVVFNNKEGGISTIAE